MRLTEPQILNHSAMPLAAIEPVDGQRRQGQAELAALTDQHHQLN